VSVATAFSVKLWLRLLKNFDYCSIYGVPVMKVVLKKIYVVCKSM
jgi:hypothetical protein